MSETPATRRVYIETFGCQMNDYDSARMVRLLESIGYERTEVAKDADLVLVNTCSVRDKAEQKALSRIGRLKKLRQTRPGILFGITGCFAQREGERFLRRMPYLDLVLGTGAIERLPAHVRSLECGRGPVVDTELTPTAAPVPDFGRYLPGKGSPAAAFLTVMRGCNNYCAYCVVPYVRGPECSRPADEILQEAGALLDQGVCELTLLGQNVNSYGRELAGGIDFPALLRQVHELPGLRRLRFTTSHPKDLSDRLIAAFAELPKLAPHMHLPVQAGSNRVLAAMNRGYTVEHYLSRVDALRAARPGLVVTTDILVGFPGESEEDFRQTYALVEHVRYSNIFSFRYSVRPGTAAARWADDVPDPLKIERLMEIQALQQRITRELHQEMVGQHLAVLVEREQTEPGQPRWSGKSGCYREVHFTGDGIRLGDMVTVEIERAFANHLEGRAVDATRPGEA